MLTINTRTHHTVLNLQMGDLASFVHMVNQDPAMNTWRKLRGPLVLCKGSGTGSGRLDLRSMPAP